MTTSHELSAEDVMAVVDGELADRQQSEAASHVRSCVACQEVSEDVHAVSALLREWTVEPAPDRFVAPPGIARRPSLGPAAKLTLVAAAACVILFIAGQLALRAPKPPDQPPVQMQTRTFPPGTDEYFAKAWAQERRFDLGMQTGGARVLIVAFIDWLCKACEVHLQAYEPVLSRYERERPGEVKLIVRDWPLNQKCNPKVPTFPGHEGACVAALAVRIARDRGKAEAMIAWLFENFAALSAMSEEQVTDAIKRELQRLIGALDFDAAAAAVRPALDREIAASESLQIGGTPTFFVNGVRIPTEKSLTPQQLDAAIALELKRASGLPFGG